MRIAPTALLLAILSLAGGCKTLHIGHGGTLTCSCGGTGCNCRHCEGNSTDCTCRGTDAIPGGRVGEPGRD